MGGQTYNFAVIVGYILGILLLFVVTKIFFVPIKKIAKLILNSLIGAVVLFIINFLGKGYGFFIGINPITAIAIGLMGFPGLCLVVLLQLFF